MMHAEQNLERTMRMANFGADCIRQFAEEGLNQTRTMMEGFLGTARKTADCFEQQSAEVTEKSVSLARETLNFVQRAMHVTEPHNLLQLQTEFMGKQAELLADKSKHLVESFTRGVNEAPKAQSDLAEDVWPPSKEKSGQKKVVAARSNTQIRKKVSGTHKRTSRAGKEKK
jgi:hypothetical protein